MKRNNLTDIQIVKLRQLLRYAVIYEISIQFFPNLTAVFISKDGVDLKDYGGDFDFAIDKAIDYLNKINQVKWNSEKHKKNG